MNCKTMLRILPKWCKFLIMPLQGHILVMMYHHPLMSLKDNSHEALLYSSVAEAWEAKQAQSLKPQSRPPLLKSLRPQTTRPGCTIQRCKLNWRSPGPMCTHMSKCPWWCPWDRRLLGVREPVTHHTLRPFYCKLSDFIGMGNHSSLRSHIIRGWEMLTNEQNTKWQSEISLLCTGAMTGKSLTSSHSQADTFRERGEQQSLMSPPPLYTPWNCCSSQSMAS